MLKKVWNNRRIFYWVVPITFVLSCAYIVCIPRTYTSEVTLAPETESNSMGSLGSLASNFGINLGNLSSSDAIYPTIYPDVLSSKRFMMSMLTVSVTTSKGETCTYKEFLIHQKFPFWQFPRRWLMGKIAAKRKKPALDLPGESQQTVVSVDYDTYMMLEGMNRDITCNVDMKTDVITINVKAQDPMVAALIADTVRVRLQNLITDYRTQKARNDVEYYQARMTEAYQNYLQASEAYSHFADANGDLLRNREKLESERLKDEMDIAQSVYAAFQKQYLASQAKMQESTPAFTVLEQAFVPVKAAKPKRMIFVLAMTILSVIGTGCWILRKEIVEWF